MWRVYYLIFLVHFCFHRTEDESSKDKNKIFQLTWQVKTLIHYPTVGQQNNTDNNAATYSTNQLEDDVPGSYMC
jgi:hypothetical protein